MEILLENCKEFFDNKGLNTNAGKCTSLRVVPVPKNKLRKVITKHHRKWGDEEIPPINFKDLARYLGADFQPDGSIRL